MHDKVSAPPNSSPQRIPLIVRKRAPLSDPTASGQNPRSPQFVTALARGLHVLGSYRQGDGALGNQQIAERTGLPKPTVSRLTYTLSRLGYLSYQPEVGKYRLGAAVMSLGFTCLGTKGIRDLARPLLQALADETGTSVALGTRDNLNMVYVECCRADSTATLALDVGSHIKLATSAMGRALLAGMSAADRQPLLDQIAAREGDHWPTIRAGIESALEDYARLGFTLSAGDWKQEVNAAGVPLLLGGDHLSYALNCGAPAYMLPRDHLIEVIGPRLKALAEGIRHTTSAAR